MIIFYYYIKILIICYYHTNMILIINFFIKVELNFSNFLLEDKKLYK